MLRQLNWTASVETAIFELTTGTQWMVLMHAGEVGTGQVDGGPDGKGVLIDSQNQY